MSTSITTTICAGPEAHHLDGLLAPSGTPRRPGALAASATFGWRAMLKIKHDPKQLTDVIAIPVLFTVLFTYILGGTIGGTPGHYLTSLLPATLVMGITACTMYGGARLSRLAEAPRDLMNNTSGAGGPVAWSLVATAAITLLFAPLTLHLYGKQK